MFKGKFRILKLLVSIIFIISLMVLPGACGRTPGPNPPGPTLTPASTDLAILDTLVTRVPSEIDNSALPITPVDKLHPIGTTPPVDITQYRLTVTGLVENEQSFTYDDIQSLPTVTKTVLLICYGTFADNAAWTGVLMSTLLTRAGVKDGATSATFYALDGYHQVIPLETLKKDGAFIAYKVNGEILPAEPGYPVRLVVPNEYGNIWVKWISSIEIR